MHFFNMCVLNNNSKLEKVMEYQLNYVRSLKAVKVLHSICQQIWETQQWLQEWKRSVFHFSSKEGQCQKHSNTIVLISHASKVLLKILQVTLKQYMKQDLQDVQAGIQRGRGTRNLSALLR